MCAEMQGARTLYMRRDAKCAEIEGDGLKSVHSCNVRAVEVESLSVQCFCEGFVKICNKLYE